ncbi:hypothetical protein G4B88_021018 [Cannabis sativa]|uniref:RNase H type-1 domain-containing protein n=1 Tax=Cannabis sativa TaxID=3483 RepID=A0A7J6GAB1_CANSA|nr:hypothetical protein G4B88_021018 [Cannabis sativa]
MDLHEVPIIYENNVIPGEGKNKRRKTNANCLNNIESAISGFVLANDGSDWRNSDHRPLVFKAQVANVDHKENKPWGSRFHFEKAWAENDECMEIIKEVWSNKYSRQPVDNLNLLLKGCGDKLQRWNQLQKTALNSRFKELKDKINRLANSYPWLPRGVPFDLRAKVNVPEGVTIHTLLNHDGSWKCDELTSWFHHEDVLWVLGIKPNCEREDIIDICHALWYCSKTQALWKHFGFLHLFPPNISMAPDFLFIMKDRCSKDTFILFLGVTWLIWHRRNKSIFQQRNFDNKVWIEWASNLLDYQLQLVPTPPLHSLKKAPVSWSPPPSGTFKINTDASLIAGQPGCGLGVVIRDHLGIVVVAETVYIPGCLSVNMAESLAIHSGLLLANRWSLSSICISSDCQPVIHALNGENHSISDWGLMLVGLACSRPQRFGLRRCRCVQLLL